MPEETQTLPSRSLPARAPSPRLAAAPSMLAPGVLLLAISLWFAIQAARFFPGF